MHEITIADRLEAAREACGIDENRLNPEDRGDAVVDVLTNLMHYCAVAEIDFENAVATASDHFAAEA